MGADFCAIGIPWPAFNDGRPKPPSLELATEVIVLLVPAVDELSEAELAEVWENHCNQAGQEQPDILAEVLSRLVKAANDVFGSPQQFRELGRIRVHGTKTWLLVSAGLTWGDAPTDAWDALSILSACWPDPEREEISKAWKIHHALSEASG